jgi:hypothetical protein
VGEQMSAEQWLSQVRPGSRVLLVNPYVQDVRYPWVRWNQPVDLLKLATLLQSPRFSCQVELIDCMLPTEAGRVTDRYVEDLATGERYRTFGVVLDKSQRSLLHELNQVWPPDYVVLSTLTSYWGPRVIPSIRSAIRSAMPQVRVVLTGGFAVHETARALRTMVDTVVSTFFDLTTEVPNWSLYKSELTEPFHEGRKCRFAGLTFPKDGDGSLIAKQIVAAKESGLYTFVFFAEDLFAYQGKPLSEALDWMENAPRLGRIDIHGLCGITPSRGDASLWDKMSRRFKSVHLEYDRDPRDGLRLDAYVEASSILGGKLSSGDLSGFVMVGCPGDDLEVLVSDTLDILATVGSIIPKPYTPSPLFDRGYYDDVVRHAKGRLDKLGPRAFPLEGHPDMPLTRQDFEDFFGLTTELNRKQQGKPFDLFDQSAITEAFRASLGKGVWKLAE